MSIEGEEEGRKEGENRGIDDDGIVYGRTIWSLTVFPSSSIVRILKSTCAEAEKRKACELCAAGTSRLVQASSDDLLKLCTILSDAGTLSTSTSIRSFMLDA